MSKVFFEDSGMRVMEKYLDLSLQRQSLISSNVANVDTPGYKTVDLPFSEELKGAMRTYESRPGVTNARHMPLYTRLGKALPEEVDGLTIRNDLNNVNIDREMSQLAGNTFKFGMVAQMIAGKFRTLRAAILEGR